MKMNRRNGGVIPWGVHSNDELLVLIVNRKGSPRIHWGNWRRRRKKKKKEKNKVGFFFNFFFLFSCFCVELILVTVIWAMRFVGILCVMR